MIPVMYRLLYVSIGLRTVYSSSTTGRMFVRYLCIVQEPFITFILLTVTHTRVAYHSCHYFHVRSMFGSGSGTYQFRKTKCGDLVPSFLSKLKSPASNLWGSRIASGYPSQTSITTMATNLCPLTLSQTTSHLSLLRIGKDSQSLLSGDVLAIPVCENQTNQRSDDGTVTRGHERNSVDIITHFGAPH